jgi:hypothetical protein
MRALLLLVAIGLVCCLAAVVHTRLPPCTLAEEVALPTVQTALSTTYTGTELWRRNVRNKALPGWVDGAVWRGLDRALGEVREAGDLHRALPPDSWDKPACTLLLSPDGIFSHYTSEDTVLASNDSGLFFSRQPSHCWPRHIRKTLSPADALPLMQSGQHDPRIALMANYATVRYLRITLPVATVLQQLGQRAHAEHVTGISLYFSDQGALTNFHWDGRPGLLQQFRGRKRVWLVHPQYSPYLAHPEGGHPQCKRRSRFTGREERPMIPHWSVVVHPGQTVFIPAKWWHQVESLDQPTIGGIVRFT